MVDHLSPSHWVVQVEEAPVNFVAVICVSPISSILQILSRERTLQKSARFHVVSCCEVPLKTYPARYKQAFAFSAILYPQPHGLALRLTFLI
jgi:hypothetical protein